MRGPRPVPCIFPDGFLEDAIDTVRRRTASVQDVQRFRLVLLLQEWPSISHEEAAEIVGLSARQVQRWRRRWVGGDFSIEDDHGRGKKPTFSPGRSRRSHRDGVRGRRRNRTADQSTVGSRLGRPSAKSVGQADQREHGVANTARRRHQAVAVRALDLSA
jgi:hypothetical protein